MADEAKKREAEEQLRKIQELTQARKAQKTNEGVAKPVVRHRLIDGKEEKAVLARSEAVGVYVCMCVCVCVCVCCSGPRAPIADCELQEFCFIPAICLRLSVLCCTPLCAGCFPCALEHLFWV